MKIHENNLYHLARVASDHVAQIEQNTDDLDWYIVGGAVRDALMDRPHQDLDFVVVNETPESMMERGFNDIQATSFPVFMDSDGDEWALSRTENKSGSGYHGFEIETDNVFLTEDLDRRDLSINAMAVGSIEPIKEWIDEYEHRRLSCFPDTDGFWDYDTIGTGGGVNMKDIDDDFVLVDRNGGIYDLEKNRLNPATEKFKEDPIRALRLARYAARFPELQPTDEAISMSREIAYELNRCSRERIGDEVVKALSQAEEPRRFWEVLRDTGALAVIFPELDRATLVPAGPEVFHMEGDTFEHTMMVLDRMHSICQEEGIQGACRVRRLLMAVAHDIGKVTIADEKGGLLSDPVNRFGGHAVVGKAQIPHIADKLGLEKQYEKVMQDACEYHMTFFDVGKVPDNVDDHQAPYNAKWAYSLLSNFDYEHSPETSTVYGATPWEMIDLIQADHEGRLEPDAEPVKVGDTWTWVEDEDDPEYYQPTLDRDPYERVVEVVIDAATSVDGYTVMREGLCDEHNEMGYEDEEIHGVLVDCNDCRSPDSWIGERIDDVAIEQIMEEWRRHI